jgi:hypothetical protein
MYVHVGCPKSGTTFLQTVLWASRRQLADQGLQIPLERVADHFHVALALRGMHDESIDAPRDRAALERLAAELPSLTATKALISHDVFAPATPDQVALLHGILREFEVHVLITARDLARQIPSHWQQRIKERAHNPYDDFATAVLERSPASGEFWANQDVADIATRWLGSLPADRLHLVTVPPPGSPPGTLLERFSRAISIDPSALETQVARGNPSLGLVQIELLRRVNVALGDRLPHPRAGYGRVGKRHLAERMLAPQGGQPPVLPANLVDRCLEVSNRMVEELRKRDYDVVGELDDLLPRGLHNEVEQTSPTEGELLEAAVQALADMLDQRHRDLVRIDALREKTAARQVRIREAPARTAPRKPRPRG